VINLGAFRSFFRYPGVPPTLIASLAARLPAGMVSVALLLSVAHHHSYADAGLVVAVYSVGSGLAAPLRGRAAARKGLARAVTSASVAQGILLVALGLVCSGPGPLAAPLVLSFGAGATLPPLNPAMRALWNHLLREDQKARNAASAFESMIVDLTYIVGPLITSLVLLAGPAPVALLVAGGLRIAGSVWLVTTPLLRHGIPAKPPSAPGAPSSGARRLLGPLLLPRVALMMPISFLLFGSISAVEVAITVFSQRHGHSAAAGLLIGMLSVGGVAGGVLWGAWSRRPGSTSRQLAVLLVLLAVGWALGLVVSSLIVLAVLLVLAGLVMNPSITAQFDALDEFTPSNEVTEAFGWSNAMNAAGIAIGAAVAGALAAQGPLAGFAVAAVMAAAAALCAVVVARTDDRSVPGGASDGASDGVPAGVNS
jgi:predicted MFS family arabinose efflux permease